MTRLSNDFYDFADPVTVSTKRIQSNNPDRFAYRHFAKRLLDVVFVVASLPLTLPFIALMALAVMAQGHSPFYAQKRVGMNGRQFRMWKLRTMVPNAEAALALHLDANPEARAEWDSNQKLKDDPRITPVGRVLRKSSMDELPQIFNVLLGSMSLVGPRPMMVCQQSAYPGTAYYNLRPGITGPWQVTDRNESDFLGRVPHDESYHREVSFATDLRLLSMTVGVVLRGTGH